MICYNRCNFTSAPQAFEMDEFISIEKLIKTAKGKGLDFGTGDPYNRLRYYTKIGWLPHMVRKIDKRGNIKGHYPAWSVDRLLLIEDLKNKGYSNEEITEKLETKNSVQGIVNAVKSPDVRKQLVLYSILTTVVLIFGNELGIIRLGKSKNLVYTTNQTRQSIQIIQSGTSFVPRNQNKIFVMTQDITVTSKVYVTFTQNYSPANKFWVSQIKQGDGFILELDAPVSNNVEFNWWLTQ
jgi:DNA-binding transcriptional MerR regulator